MHGSWPAMPHQKALATREVEEAFTMDEELTVLQDAIRTGRFEQYKAYTLPTGELCEN